MGDYQVTEYDLQNASGVLAEIESSSENFTSRKDVLLNLYARPTIPFKLECEEPNQREKIVTEIQSTR